MIKLTGAGVNHIMVSGNESQHQTRERPEQEVPATMCVQKGSENSSKPHYYVQQLHRTCNRQEPKNGLGVFSCGETSAPAWSQDGGQGENHKVKIEAPGAGTCPAQIKGGRGHSIQQSASMTDGGLSQVTEDLSSGVYVLQDAEHSRETRSITSVEKQR